MGTSTSQLNKGDTKELKKTKLNNNLNPPSKFQLETIEISLSQLELLEPTDDLIDGPLRLIYKAYFEIKEMKDSQLFFKAGNLLSKRIFLNFCTENWNLCHNKPSSDKDYFLNSTKYQMIKSILLNYTYSCPRLCEEFFQQEDFIKQIISEFSLPQLSVDQLKDNKKRFCIKTNLGILQNILQHCDSNKQLLRKYNGIKLLQKYLSSTYLVIKAKVMIVLTYCVNDEESERITTGFGVIAFLLKLLTNALLMNNHIAHKYGFSAVETIVALNRLSSNDNNKVSLIKQGVLSLLMNMIFKSLSNEETRQCANCLWTLSFHKDYKDLFVQENKLMEFVNKTLKSQVINDKRLYRACNGIYFNIYGSYFQRTELNDKVPSLKPSQIMISFQWEVKPQMKKICNFLTSSGYTVWIDNENSEGPPLALMASAVEDAQVIIVAMSEKYKNSNSSRTEAEYAYKLNKPIVPLLVEKNYRPDGWLGSLIGTQMYIDITSSYRLDEKFPEIHQQIFLKSSTKSETKSNHFSLWTAQQVQQWANSSKIDGLVNALKDFDGFGLEALYEAFKKSPDFFYRAISKDFKLSLVNQMKFIRALQILAQ